MRVIFTIAILLQGSVFFAQWRDATFLHLGPNDGISGTVRDIVQDKKGFLYFATDQGLYRYDGHEFTFYGHDPSDSTTISERQVFSLIAASDGAIYLSTFTSGLNRFDPKTEQFEHINIPEPALSDRTGAIAIAEDLRGNIWIGGYHYYLYKYDPKTKQVERFSPDWVDESRRSNPGNDFRSVYPDRKDPDKLWLTVHGERPIGFDFPTYGLMSFDIGTQTFSRVNGAGTIHYQDDNGHLWAGLWGDFITEIIPSTGQCIKHSYTEIHAGLNTIYQKSDVSRDIIPYQDQLLVASGHILQFDQRKGFKLFHQCEGTRQAECLFVDNHGLLWVGTDNGVEVYDKRSNQIEFFSLSDYGNTQRIYPGRLAYDDQKKCFYLVASTPQNDSRIYNIHQQPSESSRFIKTSFIPHSVFVGNDGEVLATGNGKLFHLDEDGQTFNLKPEFEDENMPYMYSMFEHGNHTIGFSPSEILWWTTGVDVINRFHVNELNLTKPISFSCVATSRAHELLITSGTRVYQLDLDNGKSRELQIQTNELINSDFSGIDIDINGNVWLGIRSSLFKFTLNQNQLLLDTRYGVKDGLTSPTIKEIICDAYNRVWIFHNSGMNCLDIESGEIRFFGTRHGLPIPNIDPVQVIEIENGQLATVCGNGLIKWHPDSLWNSVEPRAAQIVIQSVQVNGEPILADLDDTQLIYQLPVGPKVLTVQYQALVFPTDQNVTYRYRIHSDQAQWIHVENSRTIAIPEVPYGQSTLQIQVATANADAPISELTIHNPTPLTKRFWFPFAMIALVATIGYWIYTQRVRRIQQRADEKTQVNKKLAELELTALRSQMNPHFMFNSLNSIKTYILEADPDTAADYLSQFAHLIRRILQHSREKLIPLNEEIETLQLYINLEQFRFENAFEFELHVDRDIEIDEVMIPPLLLQPYIENAIWHGLMQKKSEGMLTLQFIDQGDHIDCIIDDNGIGRDRAAELKSLSSQKHKSMGMGITANRVRILNQLESFDISIQVIDKKNGQGSLGTRVVARIPKSLDI